MTYKHLEDLCTSNSMGIGIRKRSYNDNHEIMLEINGNHFPSRFIGRTEQEVVDQAESYLKSNFPRHFDNALFHAKDRAKQYQDRWG